MKSSLQIAVVLCPLLLTACASHPIVMRPVPPPATRPLEAVRYPEVIRTYHVGRYVDPGHPGTMHAGHDVYRVEASSRWNLHPGAVNESATLNPPQDAAFAPAPANDAVIAELNHQREVTSRILKESDQLLESYRQIEKAITKMKDVARDDTGLKAQIARMEQRLEECEQAVRNATAPSASSGKDLEIPSPQPSTQ